ncbi:hypothetical protein MSG28_010348 [Choristoneura fumiferana]|uniref:Uncharacterized protein n=1 Tax=Choristoneura fumiferana TaxID=7141 RepID=A0ACC0KLB1_CHOFU|nr:hypothetical protein MSG28_010348 [Choristoneura fumiferana]
MQDVGLDHGRAQDRRCRHVPGPSAPRRIVTEYDKGPEDGTIHEDDAAREDDTGPEDNDDDDVPSDAAPDTEADTEGHIQPQPNPLLLALGLDEKSPASNQTTPTNTYKASTPTGKLEWSASCIYTVEDDGSRRTTTSSSTIIPTEEACTALSTTSTGTPSGEELPACSGSAINNLQITIENI